MWGCDMRLPVIILSVFIKTSLSCNGYSLKINHIGTCAGQEQGLIQMENPEVVLNPDCTITMSGCTTVTKTFKTATIHYKLKKPPMPTLEGNIDGCKILKDMGDDPQVQKVASMFGLSSSCPIQATKVCGTPDKKIDISKYKNQLGLAAGAPIDIHVDVDTDAGKACLEYNLQITRTKQRKG